MRMRAPALRNRRGSRTCEKRGQTRRPPQGRGGHRRACEYDSERRRKAHERQPDNYRTIQWSGNPEEFISQAPEPRPEWRNRQTRWIQNPVPVKGVGVRVPPLAPALPRTYRNTPLRREAPPLGFVRVLCVFCGKRESLKRLRPPSRAGG